MNKRKTFTREFKLQAVQLMVTKVKTPIFSSAKIYGCPVFLVFLSSADGYVLFFGSEKQPST
jgi:hypothetical protein